MSLTLREFQHTIAPLAGHSVDAHVSSLEIPLAEGSVTITYDARPSVRFGGLLDIPRALVSLTFTDVPSDQQSAFVKRFDLTFQRGGG